MQSAEPPGHHIVKRVVLTSVTLLASVNVWTGAPLFAVWVGSRFQGGGPLTMGTVFVVIVVLAVVELALLVALSWCSVRYDELTGRRRARRRTAPWLSSLSGEREEVVKKEEGVSAIERVVAVSFAAAAIAFEIWFFFFAGSSLPNG
jgi:hypothetical protein